MAGRPPKPTHLHVIQGTVRAHRHVLKGAPQPPRAGGDRPGIVPLPPPEHLGDAERAAWHKLVAVTDSLGVLTVADAIALERLACILAEIQECHTVLAVECGSYETISRASGKMVRAHPAVARLADLDRRFRSYATEFGLTPRARNKVRVAETPGADPTDAYFSR